MATRYRFMDFDSEEERLKDPAGPPWPNLFAAGHYISILLEANDIPFAFMGGFAMRCRGSRRPTHDIDVAVKTTMRTIWAVIEPQPRLIIPDTKLVEGIIKIFVKTGQDYGDDVTEDRSIEVDLVMPGNKGTPLELSSHMELLEVTLGKKASEFPTLNVLYMMKTKLSHCLSRGLPRDYDDILFLLNNCQAGVQGVVDEISLADRRALLDLDRFKQLVGSDLDRFRVLLEVQEEQASPTN